MALRQLVKRVWVIPVGITAWDLVLCVCPVEGRSMQPVLNPEASAGAIPSRNWVLVDRWSAGGGRALKRGDVVTLIHPEKPNASIVKRIVALEGDVIKTSGYKENEYLKIPRGQCWIEGDHPQYSKDSNTYGSVPLGLVTGKVRAVVWPVTEARRVESVLPSDAVARQIHVAHKEE